MAQTINTNIASLTAQRNLTVSQKEANQAMERLSSGLRINSAKDDAAGLAISNRLTAQINGINQAVRNANDGLSVSQVAEGAMAETSTLLQRMRELAVQSANASNSSADRTALQTEVTQLIAEMDRIATNTKFGSTALLDGTYTSQAFQVGANASETMSVSISSAKSTALGSTSSSATTVNFANFKSANATASTAAASLSSGVAAQTLSLEVNGTQTNVAVAADATAATIATSFNAAQTDVVAAASTGARLDASTGVEASDTVTLSINGTSLGALATTTAATASANIAAAITGNATLSATLTATDNGDGTVDIRDSSGGDITVVFTNGTDANSNNTFTVQELNTAGTLVGVAESITTTQGTTVTGDLTFTVSDSTKSYALFSSDGSGALTSATSATDGKGASENITFNNFNTADAGASAATAVDLLATAQTLTFTTDGVSDSIAIADTDTAATIAQSITNNISGFTAKAITGARYTVSGTAGAGTITPTINGVSLGTVSTATSAATHGGLLATAINNNVALSKTLTAVDNGDGSVDIFDATGANIVFDDLTQATTTMTMQVQALDAAGVVSGSAQTITSGQGTSVMGDVLMSVDDTTKTYSVHSSVGTGITSATAAGNGAGTVSSTTTTTSAISAVDISTVAGATSALTSIDAALTSLDSQRASLGAVQNRFDSVISNLSNVSENTSAARSRIMDADFAAETAQLAKTQILQQAGISVLAQANAQPQNILALLQ